MENTYITGPVTLGGTEHSTVLASYDPRERWNGWLCPWLDPWSIDKIVEWVNDDENPDDHVSVDYEEDGTLVFTELRYIEEGGVERIAPDEDGLYSFGAYAWCWYEVTNDDDEETSI